jgi:glycine/serine hydroxymethyltransferase
MKEEEATALAKLMIHTMRHKDDAAVKAAIKNEVEALCEAFPVPERFV